MEESARTLLLRAQAGDREAAQEMVARNTGLIWSVARRFFGRGVEADDLYQLGCVGFLKAVQGFDVEYGTQFSTYAVPKIAGEIRRFLRDDGSVKVSRGLKERARAVEQAKNVLRQRLDREPTVGELAAETGFSVEDIAQCEGAAASVESLQRAYGEDGFTLENVVTDGSREETLLEHVALREAVSRLPDRERAVIVLRYYRGMTQEAAARVLGVSQVQVSRLERRILSELRDMLA